MVFLITGDGGLEHEFGIFHHIWSVILPIDSYFSRWFLHHQPVITIISRNPPKIQKHGFTLLQLEGTDEHWDKQLYIYIFHNDMHDS